MAEKTDSTANGRNNRTIYLPGDQHEMFDEARRIARALNTSISQVVSLFLADYVAKNRSVLKLLERHAGRGGISAGRDGNGR